MSYLELIRTSVKKTDKKIQNFPKRYYFIPAIIIATAISIFIFFSNPYWYTWTIESSVATITIVSLVIWAVGVLLSLFSITIFLFVSILLQEQRKEAREKRRDEVIEIFYATLAEKGKDLNDELLKDLLQKLSSLLDSIPDEPDQVSNKKQYVSFNDAWKERIRKAENNRELELEVKNLSSRVDQIERKDKEDDQLFDEKTHTQNKDEKIE